MWLLSRETQESPPTRRESAERALIPSQNSTTMNPLKALGQVLATRIHPICGNPIFAGVTTVFFGGFFTFTRNSAARDRAILGAHDMLHKRPCA